MNRNFKSIAVQHIDKFNLKEAQGVSFTKMELPVSYKGISSLLSHISGNASRARVLSWINGQGLMDASKGREQLLQKVREAVENMTNANISNPTIRGQSVKEMARDTGRIWGRDSDDTTIQSSDLFSREAWEAMPVLKEVRIDGKNILEYYRDNYEPKEITIGYHSKTSSPMVIDIDAINDSSIKLGLTPFQFGGFNGYIQYLEKGDWLPDHKKRRVFSKNDQYGFDMRPEMKFNKETGSWEFLDDIESNIGDNKLFHFQSGSFTDDPERATNVVTAMAQRFNNMARAIKNGNTPIDASDEEMELFNRLDRTSEKIDGEVAGRQGASIKYGLPNYNKAKVVNPVPYPHIMSQGQFFNLIFDGLKKPYQKLENSLKNPDAFGPEVDSVDAIPEEGGWTRSGNRIIYRFPQHMRDAIFNYIMKPSRENKNGMMNTNFYLRNIKELESASFSNNAKLDLSSIINNTMKGKDEFSHSDTGHRFLGINSKNYIFKQGEVKIKLPGFFHGAPGREVEELISRGYRWDKRNIDIKNGEAPFTSLLRGDPDAPTEIFLTDGKNKYRVAFDLDDESVYLHIPDTGKLEPTDPASHGDIGTNTLLGSKNNLLSSGENPFGHLKANAAGKKDWEEIRHKLLLGLNGGLGEYDEKSDSEDKNGPFRDETELPSVKKGVAYAKSLFNKQNLSLDSRAVYQDRSAKVKGASAYFDHNELVSWAVEALRLHSNDPAFFVGWYNQQEFDELSGRSGENKKRINLMKELEKQKSGKDGKGLYANMLKMNFLSGKDDEESKRNDAANIENVTNGLSKIIKRTKDGNYIKAIDDAWGDPNLTQIIARNGFEFRARMIAQFVLAKMNERYESDLKSSGFKSSQYSDDDGDSQSSDYASKGYDNERGDYEGDSIHTKPEDLAKFAGIKLTPRQKIDRNLLKPDLGLGSDNSATLSRNSSEKSGQAPTYDVKSSGVSKKPIVSIPSKTSSTMSTSAIPSGVPDFFNMSLDDLASMTAAPKTTPPTIKPKQANPGSKYTIPANVPDFFNMSIDDLNKSAQPHPAQPQPAQPQPAQPRRKYTIPDNIDMFNFKFEDAYSSSDSISEDLCGTSVVSVKKKPKDGDGFNWWGAIGRKDGTSVAGEVETVKTDPDGKKGVKVVRKGK